MTDTRHEALLADLVRDVPLLVVGPSRGPVAIDAKYTTIIGTSGSTDCLNDTTGERRFWPVSVAYVDDPPDDGQGCDGLHDENAPIQYLCSRCFPNLRGDLTELQNDEYDEARRDEDEEME